VRLIGTIVRLQIQESSLKVGDKPRRYDPAPIQSVPAISLSAAGVVGLAENGETIVDVHHHDHPASKNRGGENGISLGFTGHYQEMRQRFGPHLADGIAGENILIEADRQFQEEELAAGVVVDGAAGRRLELRPVIVAAPCVEFSRYALKFPDGRRPDTTVTEALRFLDAGMRGFYATYEGEPAVIEVGARVFLS
jgi:MOSC domain-containing protein